MNIRKTKANLLICVLLMISSCSISTISYDCTKTDPKTIQEQFKICMDSSVFSSTQRCTFETRQLMRKPME